MGFAAPQQLSLVCGVEGAARHEAGKAAGEEGADRNALRRSIVGARQKTGAGEETNVVDARGCGIRGIYSAKIVEAQLESGH